MNKAVRINLLVVTIVITLFVLAGLYFMRPGVPNGILEQAAKRQSVPLMEVQPPVKKPALEEVANTSELADRLLPVMKERIVDDQELVDNLSEVVHAKLQVQLDESFAALENELVAIASERVLPDTSEIEQKLIAMGSDGLGDIYAYIPQLVDSRIPEIITQVLNQIEADSGVYIDAISKGYGPALSEEELVVLYNRYRDQIVLDLVPKILDEIESRTLMQLSEPITVEPVVQAVVEPVETAPAIKVPAPPTIKSVVKTVVVPQPVIEEEVAEQPTVSQMVEDTVEPIMLEQSLVTELAEEPVLPMDVETEPIVAIPPASSTHIPVPIEGPVVDEPQVEAVEPVIIEEIAQPPVEEQPAVVVPPAPSVVKPVATPQPRKEGQPAISAPVFEPKETVEFLEPETYEQQRKVIREKAIEDVLTRIGL